MISLLTLRPGLHVTKLMIYSSSNYRPSGIGLVRLARSSTTTASSTTSPETETRLIFKNLKSENDNSPTPPPPPKDFKSTYKQRPLFGLAMKGNKVYSEATRLVRNITFGIMLIYFLTAFYIKIDVDYFTPEEVKRRYYEQSPKAIRDDPQMSSMKALLAEFANHSALGAWLGAERNSAGLMNPREGTPPSEQHGMRRQMDPQYQNRNEIITAADVLPREQTGRREGLYKSLAEFDAELRATGAKPNSLLLEHEALQEKTRKRKMM